MCKWSYLVSSVKGNFILNSWYFWGELQRFILRRDPVSCQGGICLHTLQDLVKYSHFLGTKMPLLPQLTRPWIPGPGLLHTEIKTKVSLWAGMWNSNACLCTRKQHLISLISKNIHQLSVIYLFSFSINYFLFYYLIQDFKQLLHWYKSFSAKCNAYFFPMQNIFNQLRISMMSKKLGDIKVTAAEFMMCMIVG